MDRPIDRRKFLRTTGAAIAGGALIGASSGTASAQEIASQEVEASSTTHLNEHWSGDPNGDYVPWFRYMCRSGDARAMYDRQFQVAKDAMDDLVSKSPYIDGALTQFLEFDSDQYLDYTPTKSELDSHLDDMGGFSDRAVYIWDCGEVNHGGISDWDTNRDKHDVHYEEPAMTSDVYHPAIESTHGSHVGDYPHVRVRVAGVNIGRMPHAAAHTLVRIRDQGYWWSSDDPPKGVHDPDDDWELGTPVHDGTSWTGTEQYIATLAGDSTNDTRLETTDNGTCGNELPSSGYTAVANADPSVTYCLTDTISEAMDWFLYS